MIYVELLDEIKTVLDHYIKGNDECEYQLCSGWIDKVNKCNKCETYRGIHLIIEYLVLESLNWRYRYIVYPRTVFGYWLINDSIETFNYDVYREWIPDVRE